MRSRHFVSTLAVLALTTALGCGAELLGDGELAVDDGAPDVRAPGGHDTTPSASDELIPGDIERETLDLVREATEMGLMAGKALVAEGINTELARNGVDHTYVGGESLVDIPEDVLVECPYVLHAGNDGSTEVSCRILAEDARDHAYIHEADTLARLHLGPRFDQDRELHSQWMQNGLTSGIEGEFIMAVRRLREARVCDQEPTPVQSSREQGIAMGRDLMEEAVEAQLAVTPITECDIDGGIVNPALSSALGRVDATLEANPLCAGYEPSDMDDRAEFLQAQNEYRGGVRAGVEEGAIIASEQLFRTWVCQTPAETGGGGGGGGGGDPLVLDLDGDGVRVSSPAQGVNFVLGESGMLRTGWIADPDDGFLVIDHDGNGRVDNGLELLGDMSWSADNLNEANGMLSLARYDGLDLGGNGDGVIDARDAVYGALSVWRDRDLDGRTDDGELASLAELGIESIALDYVTEATTLSASFERTDGTTGAAVDVWFRYL